MTIVRTGSRLHFGVFSLPPEESDGASRFFGGVGLMVRDPGIEVELSEAVADSHEGNLGAAAQHFLDRLRTAWRIGSQFHVRAVSNFRQHVGLGSGTQLAMAVAHAMLDHWQPAPRPSLPDLATSLDRGKRSWLGVHGYQRGGFLVEAGKSQASAPAPLVIHQEFPEEWAILLVIPRHLQGLHGEREVASFQQLAHTDPLAHRDVLARLVLLDMVPALIERDLDAFGEALFEFNRRVGELFRVVQGDVYAHPSITAVVGKLRGLGIRGVGQSSWGPTVFAVLPREEASSMLPHLTQMDADIVLTSALSM